jgi:thiosulfate/3-mercaptopyruvate sulfurtransferase
MNAGARKRTFVSVTDLASVSDLRDRDGGFDRVDARAERAYAAAHLPGSVSLPAHGLNAPSEGVRRLVGSTEFRRLLRERGIGEDPVVVYGARGSSDAAHVWWTLHAYGHPNVFILDGGIEAWRASGLELTSEPATVASPRAPFEPRLTPERRIASDELLDRLDDPGLAIVDTRSPGEYDGEDVLAERGGHITGAELLPWDELLTDDGRLLSREALCQRLARLLSVPEVALYCQSGVRAAHTYATLRELGHTGVRLYLESWAEWGNRHDTAITAHREVTR